MRLHQCDHVLRMFDHDIVLHFIIQYYYNHNDCGHIIVYYVSTKKLTTILSHQCDHLALHTLTLYTQCHYQVLYCWVKHDCYQEPTLNWKVFLHTSLSIIIIATRKYCSFNLFVLQSCSSLNGSTPSLGLQDYTLTCALLRIMTTTC